MERSAAVATDLVKQIQGWTSLGAASEVVEKILESKFAGRRDAIRTFKFLEIVVQGTGGTFKALGINISRTGILFRITDPRFANDAEQQHLMPYTARVWQNFHGGFHVFLDFARFEALRKPSSYCPVQYFSQVQSGLFERILHREGLTVTQKQNADGACPLHTQPIVPPFQMSLSVFASRSSQDPFLINFEVFDLLCMKLIKPIDRVSLVERSLITAQARGRIVVF